MWKVEYLAQLDKKVDNSRKNTFSNKHWLDSQRECRKSYWKGERLLKWKEYELGSILCCWLDIQSFVLKVL